jgi:hypothetical protein
MRQLVAATLLSALAIAAMVGALGPAGAADMPAGAVVVETPALACAPQETVILFKEWGHIGVWSEPTVPARTPYFTCVTGTTLLPGEIPPPPEYCCG